MDSDGGRFGAAAWTSTTSLSPLIIEHSGTPASEVQNDRIGLVLGDRTTDVAVE
ncbi:hypothetical protein [Arthrobacter sp. D2-10]